MRRDTTLGFTLLGAGLGAAAAFTVLATKVSRHETKAFDRKVRAAFPKRRNRKTRKTTHFLGYSGKGFVHGPLSTVVAALVKRAGSTRGAATIVLSSAASQAASKGFDHAMFKRRPPPGRHAPTEPSFPSGHSLELTALSLTAGYVLLREQLAHPALVLPLAVAVPVASGVGRLYLDRHWGTDVVAGWLGGTAIAAVCGAVYEFVPESLLRRADSLRSAASAL